MQSAIYSLDPGDKLKDYYKAINDACFEITKQNPSLVHDKKNLQKLAIVKVDADGYAYKKKKSRSKALMTTDVELNTTKAKNITQEVRTKRMNEVMEDLKEVDLQMSLYEKQRSRQTNIQQYSQAIILTEHMAELRQKKRKLQNELTDLQCKDGKKVRYREHKAKKTGAKCSSSSIGQGATIDVMLKRKACGPVAIVGATDGNNEGVDTKKQKVAIEDPHNTETSLNIEGNWSSDKGECTVDKSTKESAVLEKSSEDDPFL